MPKSKTYLHITTGSGKMAGIASLNVPVHGNPYCDRMSQCPTTVCSHCYAARLENLRPTLRAAVARNLVLAERPLTAEELRLPEGLDTLRIHSFGELYNSVHAENIVELARVNPTVRVLLWTKRPELMSFWVPLPDNLTVIYSCPALNPTPETMNHAITAAARYHCSAVYMVGDRDHGYAPCSGDKAIGCKACGLCYHLPHGELPVVIRQLLH